MKGWREGMQKVSLTKLQVDKLGLSIAASKRNVDSVLNNENVTLEIEDTALAYSFFHEAERLGVTCKLIM